MEFISTFRILYHESKHISSIIPQLFSPLPKKIICVIMLLVVQNIESAGVAEWQTHQTQNLTGATSCRFKSGRRHPWQGQKSDRFIRSDDFVRLFFYVRQAGFNRQPASVLYLKSS